MHALAGNREHETGGEAGIGRGGQPVEMADPRDHAPGQHLAFPGVGRPAPLAIGPVVNQAHRDGSRRGIAAVAQVAQPAKAVQRIEPQRVGAGSLPGRIVAGRSDSTDHTERRKLAHHQALAHGGVARPGIGRHGEEGLRRAIAQRQGVKRQAQHPATKRTVARRRDGS